MNMQNTSNVNGLQIRVESAVVLHFDTDKLTWTNSKSELKSQFETGQPQIRIESAVVLHFETDKLHIRIEITV